MLRARERCMIMTGQCCRGEGRSRRLALRLSGAAGSILPGALWVLLPKCPLCLAVWLTTATGVGVSGLLVERLRGGILVLWAAILLWGAVRLLRRYSSVSAR